MVGMGMRSAGWLKGVLECRGCVGRVWWLMMLGAVMVEEVFFSG